jgi:hypothetical protein
LSRECRDLHSRLVSKLTDISDNQIPIMQALIDDVYAQFLALIEPSQATRATKQKRSKGTRSQVGRKRNQKRYWYAKTQDLYRKNLNLLARYIREGIPWLEDEDSSSPNPEDVKSFYTELWRASPNITIPFSVDGSGHKALDIGEVFQAIRARDINERLNRTRHYIASRPDRIQRKHLTGQDMKEL